MGTHRRWAFLLTAIAVLIGLGGISSISMLALMTPFRLNGHSLARLWLLSSASTVIVFAVFVRKSFPTHAALSTRPAGFVEVVISGASAYWRHRHHTAPFDRR